MQIETLNLRQILSLSLKSKISIFSSKVARSLTTTKTRKVIRRGIHVKRRVPKNDISILQRLLILILLLLIMITILCNCFKHKIMILLFFIL
jgi:hypothetical protein